MRDCGFGSGHACEYVAGISSRRTSRSLRRSLGLDDSRPSTYCTRAFSVLLTDPVGQVLLQQRAASKTGFANAWANTCCGHPAPGIAPIPAAVARLRAELGIEAPALHERGTFLYHAHDPASGRVEHEYDHVLIGTLETPITLTLDPAEVADIQCIKAEVLDAQLTEKPGHFAPWLLGVLRIAMPTGLGILPQHVV
ncbi:MAG: isopentenyl-diphosphate Delta-isomerase [Gammaproteobacteria bacterium]